MICHFMQLSASLDYAIYGIVCLQLASCAGAEHTAVRRRRRRLNCRKITSSDFFLL